MITLEPHQIKASNELIEILNKFKFAVLNAEMRVGKTLTIIDVANELKEQVKTCLIVTKKGAIKSIENDILAYFSDKQSEIVFDVTNYESLHKCARFYDLIVQDEAHTCGYIGKKKLVNKRLEVIGFKFKILMTGSLFTETFSTAYSLFPICFRKYSSFYKWAKDHVKVKQKRIGQNTVNDYTEVKSVDNLMLIIKPYIVSLTQKEAGFSSKVNDIIHLVKSDNIEKLCKIIKDRKIFTFADGKKIVADNVPKEFQIIKQLQSGCLKIGEGDYKALDMYKFDYIMQLFKDKKIAVYHEYIGEKLMLEAQFKLFGYTITNDSQVFNEGDNKTVFLGQFVSKREGINLSSCNDLIFFSMPYSNLTYIQTRERCILKNKDQAVRCHFICTEFEKKVYDIVKHEKGKFSSESYRKLK